MNPLKSVLMIVALTLAAALVLAQDRSQAQQFQEAINMMETKGNYTAAIRLFEQAAKGPDRTLAARALYYAGQCYEKSGKDKAQQAYQRVIKQFAEQRQVVAEARARLSALSPAAGNVTANKTASGPTIRQVPDWPGVGKSHAVSPDGRYLSGWDWDGETWNIAIQDLITGEKRRLTNKPSKDEWYDTPTFSLDGKQIAYTKGIKKDKKDSYELHIVGIDGTGERVLYRNDDLDWFASCDWSPDGKSILVFLEGMNRSKNDSLALISVADGSTRILKSRRYENSPGGLVDAMHFSPDGRYIAYEYHPRDGASECGIAVISSDGSRDVPLVQSPADDRLLGWTPDGKSILFASDRSKTIDAWIIPVADGKPQGSPELVKRDLGKVWPMGFTRSGSFYYRFGATGRVTRDIYTATLAPDTGKLVGSPSLAKTRFMGFSSGHNWSPDGRYLVYRSQLSLRLGEPSEDKLFILNSETGEEREVRSKLLRFSVPSWFPDGKSILLRAQAGGAGLFKLDSATGDTALLVPEKPGSELFLPVLSHDGKAVFYQNKNILWKHNLETGEAKEIYRATPPSESLTFTQSIALSPDGQRLAFKFGQSLMVVPATGGDAQELLKLQERESGPNYNTVAWTPDGRYLLFVNNGDKQSELWRVPANGGESQKLGQLMKNVLDLRVHPDGRRIAFTVQQPAKNKAEVWVMENFLPAAQPRKASVSRR